MTVDVYAPPNRKYGPWCGGATLTALSTFEPMWITKELYDQNGPTIIDRMGRDFEVE